MPDTPAEDPALSPSQNDPTTQKPDESKPIPEWLTKHPDWLGMRGSSELHWPDPNPYDTDDPKSSERGYDSMGSAAAPRLMRR